MAESPGLQIGYALSGRHKKTGPLKGPVALP